MVEMIESIEIVIPKEILRLLQSLHFKKVASLKTKSATAKFTSKVETRTGFMKL
jgi:hypothetical protein